MSSFRDRYGESVTSLPVSGPMVLTATMWLPAAYFLVMFLVNGPTAAGLIALLVSFLWACVPFVVTRSVWRRTDTSVSQDWRAARLENRLRVELGHREQRPIEALRPDREAPPTRW